MHPQQGTRRARQRGTPPTSRLSKSVLDGGLSVVIIDGSALTVLQHLVVGHLGAQGGGGALSLEFENWCRQQDSNLRPWA